MIRTNIAWSTTTDRITVKGFDLCRDMLGGVSRWSSSRWGNSSGFATSA